MSQRGRKKIAVMPKHSRPSSTHIRAALDRLVSVAATDRDDAWRRDICSAEATTGRDTADILNIDSDTD